MMNFPKWKIIVVLLVCLGGLVLSLPNFLPKSLGNFGKTVNLGLDLRGGSYLLLGVEFDKYMKEQMQSVVDDVRSALRKEKIGYKQLGVSHDSVLVSLREISDGEKAKDVIANMSRDFLVELSDAGDMKITYRPEALKLMKQNVVEQSVEIVRRRIDETGTKEPIIQRQGDDRILLQVPGLQNPEHLKQILGRTAKMTFHLMDDTRPFPEGSVVAPPGETLLKGDEDEDPSGQRYYLIKNRAILSGDMLVDSRATFDGNQPVVSFKFNNLGGKKFAEATKENTGKPFAIVLDNKVISAPVIEEPILGGSGIIRGRFTTQQVQDLSLLLRAGALPAPLDILEERTVGPSLGQDSIDAGMMASVLGVVLVCLFMFAYYGMFGVFANIALVANILLIIACLSLLQATLTLPGIAGIVLTMGMAVDANVLIYERIKEETDLGRTPFAAIDQGFAQAYRTIIDSNITTLISTFILFVYGTGPVKGFAVTLAIGIICSMFTAVLLSRLMISVWLVRNKPSKLPI